jgi:hypothetical protein
MTEPPPQMAEEFNAWYDLEHLPERLSVPGFRSARRWVLDGKPGDGKYLATYELDSLAVLTSPAYLARFANPTPWSRRCLDSALVFERWACEQLLPGDADTHPAAQAVVLVRRGEPMKGLSLPGALQVRHFEASSGKPRHIALFDVAGTAAPGLPADWDARIYRAYKRGA